MKADWWVRFRIAAAIAALTGVAWGQQAIVYPAKGQSAEQQQKDRGECQVWATQHTGIDPVALAQTPATAPARSGHEVAGGAVGGAAGGAAIGAIAGDAGKGAAIGAIVGTMHGAREARLNQAAAQQQGQRQRQQQMDTWNRALGACMEARGYTVR